MTNPNDLRDQDERGLQELFDATAPQPDQLRLDRLARSAARIPEAKAQPWWRWLRFALPATAAAAVALALWLGQGDGSTPEGPAPVAQTEAPSPSDPPEAPDEEALGEDAELALEYDRLEDEPEELDPLADPLAAIDVVAVALASPTALLDLLDPGDDEAALEAAADGFSALLEGG